MARVLVVDDDPDVRTLVELKLRLEGLEVVSVASGEEALAMLSVESFDLVVLDLMMPGIDGIEVCRRIRERPETADLPVIMLTARAQETDVERGLTVGATDYVTKPFSPRELMLRVRGALRRAGVATGS